MNTIQTDLLILGGGITGLSIAWEAQKANLRTTLVSTSRSGAATIAAGGMLTPSAEAETASPSLIEMALQSCREYPTFISEIEEASGLDCDYRTHGTSMLALRQDHLGDLEYLKRAQERLGLRAEMLTAKEMKNREPHLGAKQRGGLVAHNDHHVNPTKLQIALKEALRKLHCPILDINSSESIKRLGETTFKIHAGQSNRELLIHTQETVVAEGVWSNKDWAELEFLPLRAIKGQFIRIKNAPALRSVIRTPDVYLVPRHGQELYIGASSDEVELLWHSWQAVPGLYESEIMELGSGFRPALPDHEPAIGRVTDNLLVATGHFRHGIMLAPASAKSIVSLVTRGPSTIDIAALDPARFKRGKEYP